MSEIPELVYTLDAAAEKLGFSRKTLQREINAGRYPNSFKVGKRSCTRASDIESYIQRVKDGIDDAERKKAEEAAARLRFQRELEAFQRKAAIMPQDSLILPGIRAFSPDDPNRLP